MTSGIPLDDKEKEYILMHIEDGPGNIAHVLNHDPELVKCNRGTRTRKTVESFIYRERNKTEEVLKIRIPAEVLKSARKKGISKDQMQFFAMRAILQHLKTPG